MTHQVIRRKSIGSRRQPAEMGLTLVCSTKIDETAKVGCTRRSLKLRAGIDTLYSIAYQIWLRARMDTLVEQYV